MNLDGGGSASLVCDGQLRNRPASSTGIELAGGRAIATVIAFEQSDPSRQRPARAPVAPARARYNREQSMAGQRRVVSAILFSPRGGSSHAARAFSALLPSEGWDSSLVAGSRRDGDPEEDARVFYPAWTT